MKPSKGLYAIVQYCPDPSRLEAANIGVLLYCYARSFCEVKMSDHNRRVRRFFGSHPQGRPAHIASAKRAIVDRVEIESPEWFACCEHEGRSGLNEFIGLLNNDILITPPRSMRVVDPKEELERLYRDLVMDPERNT